MKFILAAAALLASAAPANAAWHESKSRHFIVYGDASPAWMRAYSLKLEKFDQAVRRLQKIDDPPPGEAGRVTIFVLPNNEAVSKLIYGQKSTLAGYYVPRAGGSVAFVPRKGEGFDANDSAEKTLFHEYAHHLMYQSVDTVLPPWLVEGFAEFYGEARFEGKETVRLAMPAESRLYGLTQIARPKPEALFGAGVDMRAGEEVVEAFYAWSWLYTHYLTFSDERSGQLTRYLALLQTGTEPMAAARSAFGDLDKLGDDAKRYLERNRFKNWAVTRPPPHPSTIGVRPLHPGEIAILPTVMKLRGTHAKDPAGLAAEARSVAAIHPGDAAVMTALAEAELAADNYAAAEKAATRATELDPGRSDAWILRGRAQMELLNGGGSDEQWAKIRASFLKANALDKEDAEPLLLFYQSYGRAGQAATKNAKDGLDYALVLAPQDDGLRLTAAYQQLLDKRFKEARQSLLPLAFSPHPGKQREIARKAVATIDAGDADGARKALTD